jgi:cytochrome c oxidase subunit II
MKNSRRKDAREPARFCARLLTLGCVTAATIFFAGTVVSGQKRPRELAIEAKRFEFVPDTITLTKGEPVTLVLTADDVTHSLYVRDLKINQTIEPGEVQRVDLLPENEGIYHGSCQMLCGADHAKMKLTIVVK